MIKRYLILRPNSAGNNNLRLALFTQEYNELVRGMQIEKISIDLGNGMEDIDSVDTYIKYGSLTNKSIISDWLHKHEYTNESHLLLFELTINSTNNTHMYSFIGHKDDISDLFSKAYARLIEKY